MGQAGPVQDGLGSGKKGGRGRVRVRVRISLQGGPGGKTQDGAGRSSGLQRPVQATPRPASAQPSAHSCSTEHTLAGLHRLPSRL